jgi:hypothetical protein
MSFIGNPSWRHDETEFPEGSREAPPTSGFQLFGFVSKAGQFSSNIPIHRPTGRSS